MMSNKLPFDWKALTDYIGTIPKEGSSILITPESKRFTRLQRFIHRQSHVADPNKSRDAMIALAHEFQLHPLSAARLFIKLQVLASSYSFGRHLESVERAGDPVKILEDMSFCLSRLAKFSQNILAEDAGPRDRLIETRLEYAAHFWADNARRESAQPGQHERWDEAEAHGFRYTGAYTERGTRISRRGNGEFRAHVVPANYDSRSVVRLWLRNNILFSELVKTIIDQERKPKPSDETALEDSSSLSRVVRLVGQTLPTLYERYTRKVFNPTRGKAGISVLDKDGVLFVRKAMEVMNCKPVSPEVVREYWMKVKAIRAKALGE